MEYSNGVLVDATLKLLQMLSREVAAYSQSVAKDSLVQLLSETLSNLMKVVMNLTHDSNDDCKFLTILKLYHSRIINILFFFKCSNWQSCLW